MNDDVSSKPIIILCLSTMEQPPTPEPVTYSFGPLVAGGVSDPVPKPSEGGSRRFPLNFPPHMRLDTLRPGFRQLSTALCVLAYGRNDLVEAWEAADEDGKRWANMMDGLGKRLNAMTLIVSWSCSQRVYVLADVR